MRDMSPEQKSYAFLQRDSFTKNNIPPSPGEVIAAAFSELQRDYSVLEHDDETGEYIRIKPYEPKPLDTLPADSFSVELLNFSRAIEGVIGRISMNPETAEFEIQGLAHRLTAFRNNPAFIEYATSLVKVDEKGFLIAPQLPKGSVWEWVPRLRAELADRNKIPLHGQEN